MSAKPPNERFRELSDARRRLLRRMQDINFGQITFRIRRGEPDIDHPWRTRRMVKLTGGENGRRPETELSDFELRQAQTALLDTLSRAADGECVTVEVRHGLPFLVEIEQDHQAA